MTERPMLFSAPMVRAILAGTKTQTRRVVKPQPDVGGQGIAIVYTAEDSRLGRLGATVRCPYGQAGDRLWVREAFTIGYPVDATEYSAIPWNGADPQRDGKAFYRASFDEKPDEARMVWSPSIHMPRWASRITLEVTGVRVERLQDISEADAIAEGVERTVTGDGWRRYADAASELAGLHPCATARESYRALWESINGPGSWDANPWVWVIEFKRAA